MLLPPSTGRVMNRLTTAEPPAPRRRRRPKVPRLTISTEPFRRLLRLPAARRL